MIASQKSSKESPNTVSRPKLWWLKPILIPFLVTRTLLFITGYITPLFLPMSYIDDPAVVKRGWWLFRQRFLDMWVRWDSGWYLTIVKEGYHLVENVYTTSNLAFFPVYPILIKLSLALIPDQFVTDELIVAIGLIISNLMLLGSLLLIYKLTQIIFDQTSAKLTVWVLAAFPTSFFLSSIYTESTLLFFSLLSYWLIKKKRWGLASLTAAIAGASRPVGIFIALPLVLEYAQAKKWKIKNIDLSILWFSLVPMGILLFFSYLFYLTGDFFAALKVQEAWGRQTSNPISSFLNPSNSWPIVTNLDRVSILAVFTTSIAMLVNKSKKLLPLGLYSILLMAPNLFTGTLDSSTRFVVVIFPIFMFWAKLLTQIKGNKAKVIKIGLIGSSLIIQLILFGRYSQFYWAG